MVVKGFADFRVVHTRASRIDTGGIKRVILATGERDAARVSSSIVHHGQGECKEEDGRSRKDGKSHAQDTLVLEALEGREQDMEDAMDDSTDVLSNGRLCVRPRQWDDRGTHVSFWVNHRDMRRKWGSDARRRSRRVKRRRRS
jgi:hypothetical protein